MLHSIWYLCLQKVKQAVGEIADESLATVVTLISLEDYPLLGRAAQIKGQKGAQFVTRMLESQEDSLCVCVCVCLHMHVYRIGKEKFISGYSERQMINDLRFFSHCSKN